MKTIYFPFLLFVLTSSPICSLANTNSKKANFDWREPQLTIIESLENGESYSIEITSIGCFHSARQTVVISKKANVLAARLQASSKILPASDIETFKSFEVQLRALEICGCTTSDTQVLRYGNEIFRTSDGSCHWQGYRKLLDILS